MSNHLRNEACPACRRLGRDRKGDNLGVYDDGHKVCWSCGYYEHGDGKARLSKLAPTTVQTVQVVLPHDSDTYIPTEARLWLSRYGLTEGEIVSNRLLWSDYRKQLIFPYFDVYNNLVAWQGRSFGESKSKWFSQGDLLKLYHILPTLSLYKPIVLVEDIVSAIKVSRFAQAMPIFGSTAINRLKTLYRLTNTLVWWLDPNMKTKAALEAAKARSLGFRATQIWSNNDPKEETMEDIKKYLTDTNFYDTL